MQDINSEKLQITLQWLKTWETIEAKRELKKFDLVEKMVKALDDDLIDTMDDTKQDDVLHKIAKSIKVSLVNPYYFQTSGSTSTDKPSIREIEDLFSKYEELQEDFIERGIGWIFPAETLKRDYGFISDLMEFQTHYKVFNGAMKDDNGIHPQQYIHLTDEGIKFLIYNSQTAREKIENEWADYCKDLADKEVQNERNSNK